MYKTFGFVFSLLVGLTLAGCGGGESNAETQQNQQAQQEPASAAQAQSLQEGGPGAARGVSRGDTAAPVVLYEFADFQCPACRMSATRLFPYINRKYIQPGTVEYVFVDLPLTQIHDNAIPAHVSARCVLQQDREQFWTMHDLLFERQEQWAESSNPHEQFSQYVQNDLSEIDQEQYQTCVEQQEPRDDIQHNYQLARQLEAKGTPTFYVNDKEVYGAGQEVISEIEKAVQETTGGQGGGTN